MRISIILICLVCLFSACKKDKYTTEPQITYKSISPNPISYLDNIYPILTLEITDAEGDLGFKENVDTAFVYIKNNLTGRFDSVPFPDIKFSAKNNFKADIEVELNPGHNCVPISNVTDSIYYDVYVRDFARNKSNVITTSDPLLFRCF